MLGSMIVNRPVTIARGKLVILPGDGEIAAPGSGATITLYDQILDYPIAHVALSGVQIPQCPFSRLQLTVLSSADSAANGIVFAESQDDGVNFDTASTQTYLTASGLMTFDYACRGGHPRITYQNSAAVLTSWRFTLTGILERSAIT